jgi:hypothetical protein
MKKGARKGRTFKSSFESMGAPLSVGATEPSSDM